MSINTYVFTVPIEGSALIGREDLFRRIASLWARPGQRNSLLIHGHRRMGKTSLAQALASRCNFGPETHLVYLSIETVYLDHEGFLYYEIADRLWLEIQSEIDEPDEEEFTNARARTAFNRYLARLNTTINKTRVVLILDEFELLQKSLGLERSAQVITYLRAQTQTFHWLTLGLVGLNDLDDLRRSYGNPLLGWESIQVSFLDTAQVANILANPPDFPDFPLDYAPEALDKIAARTNGQPYLVQVIGDLLVQHYNHIVFTEQLRHSAIFNVIDIQAVVEDVKFYDTAAAYFEGVWNQVTKSQSGEIVILQVLADYNDGINEGLLNAATKLDHKAFTQAIEALIRYDVLCHKNDRICYTDQQKRDAGTYNNLLDAPKPQEMRIALSYLMASWRRVTLTLLCYPLRDLPQPLNREQRGFAGREMGITWPAVVRQAGGDGSMVTVGQANDEVRIRPSSNTDEPNALAMQRMMRVSHPHPFHRRFGKGGSLL
jgi:hypothetical protein